MEVLKGSLKDEEKRARASKGIKRKGTESYGGSLKAAGRFYKNNNGATAAVPTATAAVPTATAGCNYVNLEHFGSNYKKFEVILNH